MRIENHSHFSDALVREVLEFVAPPKVSGLAVVRTGLGGWFTYRGRAWCSPRNPRVLLRVARPGIFPLKPAGKHRIGRGYLPAPYIASDVEALVFLAAHELRHLWQMRVPRGRRVWGARGQYSERDADAYAIRTLRAWRRRDVLMPSIGTLEPQRRCA